MSFVAIAIGGAAVVGGIATVVGGNRAAGAVEAGAASAAEATVESTRMQLEEIRRQFDYQNDILLPQIQSQYNAQGAFNDLLGISGGAPQQGPQNYQDYLRSVGNVPGGGGGGQPGRAELYLQRDGTVRPGGRQNFIQQGVDGGPGGTLPGTLSEQEWNAQQASGGPQFPDSGSTQFQRGPQGEFIDPNLDPTRLADVNTLGDTVRGNLMAGTTAEADPYRNYIDQNRIASATSAEDERVRRAGDVTLASGAAGTGVYGDVFTESPGYSFAVEEMNRATDRVGSAGGNYGGRAIIEAQRRAAGLADQEYYNWAGGRERDLGRLGDAERIDIGRGDTALSQYESQRFADVGRGDQAYQDYLRRSEYDASRLDAAAGQEDALMAADQSRGDQSYYNYLQQLGMVAGFGGGPAATAVNASQAASGATVGAYAREGGNLSNIYSQLGSDQGNIAWQTAAGVNNALVSGASNYATYRAAA